MEQFSFSNKGLSSVVDAENSINILYYIFLLNAQAGAQFILCADEWLMCC